MKKTFLITALATLSFAISPYVKGYRLYIRYVKHTPPRELKAPYLLKKLNITSLNELNREIDSGEIVKKLEKSTQKLLKVCKKLSQKTKKQLKCFLIQFLKEKFPRDVFNLRKL
ncbi:hypothetical protein [Caminibacter sp.]